MVDRGSGGRSKGVRPDKDMSLALWERSEQFHAPPPSVADFAKANEYVSRHPNRIPVYVRLSTRLNIKPGAKTKFLVPRVTRVAGHSEPFNYGCLISVVRSSCGIRLNKSQALFCFVGDTLVPVSASISELYDRVAEPMIVLKVMPENTFGS